jgi:DNA polymerase-3 subunit beta
VERITGKNLTLPVLGSILFEAKGKILTLRATNLSLGIEMNISAKVEKEGVVAMRGDILNSLFSTFSNESNVLIEEKESSVFITTKNNSVVIKTLPHDDFPTLPIVSGDNFQLPSKKISDGLKSVNYSASSSDIKPEIGSVYIYQDDGNIIFTATDSFRLAEKKIKAKNIDNFNEVLIPFKNTVEILRILDGISDDVDVVVNKNQISFTAPGLYLTSRVVDSVFPDYKQIIPKNPTTEAVILKQDLINALKVSNIFSDKFNQITISVSPSKKKFEIMSKNIDIGENVSSVHSSISGEDVEVNLNYRYILDSFQSINSDSVSLSFSGNNKPVIIKPIGDQSFMYLVMPMNR